MARKKTLRKKKRSPAQRANDKRLGAMAKKRAAKKRPKKKKAVKKRAANPASKDYVVFNYSPANESIGFLQVNSNWGSLRSAVPFTTKRIGAIAANRVRPNHGDLIGVAPANLSTAAIRRKVREANQGKR